MLSSGLNEGAGTTNQVGRWSNRYVMLDVNLVEEQDIDHDDAFARTNRRWIRWVAREGSPALHAPVCRCRIGRGARVDIRHHL
jgi:hypothetical protein